MSILNYTAREMTVKIVYYGPALSGKTTNVRIISDRLPEEKKGKMVTLPTKEDRTLFFDFLPFSLGTRKNYKVRIQLYTVPGQVFYESTRRLVLQGADGVVFIADSQKELLENNIDSFDSMKKNLRLNGLNYTTIPLVVQYNKRDLPNILPVKKLNSEVNDLNRPFFPAIAIRGEGVMETLYTITELTLESLRKKYRLLADMEPGSLVSELKRFFELPKEPFELLKETEKELPTKPPGMGVSEDDISIKKIKIEGKTPPNQEKMFQHLEEPLEIEEEMPEEELFEEPSEKLPEEELPSKFKKEAEEQTETYKKDRLIGKAQEGRPMSKKVPAQKEVGGKKLEELTGEEGTGTMEIPIKISTKEGEETELIIKIRIEVRRKGSG